MAKRAEDRKTYNGVPMDYFVQKCRAIDGAGLNVNLKSENPGDNGSMWFRVHHGMTMTSYGEKITITLTPVANGTDVHILSECAMPTQLVDYGKNKQNCAAIFGYFDKGIQQIAAAPMTNDRSMTYAQPQAGMMGQQPQPVPVPVVQPQVQQAAPQAAAQPFVFCVECGAKNDRSANFCMKCGAKLIKA